jgi:hypothetical protein
MMPPNECSSEQSLQWSAARMKLDEDFAAADREERSRLREENARLRKIVRCVLLNLDRMVHRNQKPGDDPPILCGATWGKVAYVCGLGSTSARALCREFDIDPDHEAEPTP